MVRAFLDQYPTRQNRVSLSDSRDSYGVPKINIDWSFTKSDHASLLRFLEKTKEVLLTSNVGELDYSGVLEADNLSLNALHSHFMGTTRMGADARTSVVNEHGRLHSSENVYVAGPSTFSTYGSANPFLTIVALSLRLASHLKRQLR